MVRMMKVAVLSLTRDRVDYTRHCFNSLRENAGIPYDHFILDQASDDDTDEFIGEYTLARGGTRFWVGHDLTYTIFGDENIGIHRGWNALLDVAAEDDYYDVYVTFDNDCELTQHGTLKAVCDAVYPDSGWIASPTVNGLQHPLSPGPPELANGLRIGRTPIIGGICRAMPGSFVRDGFRFNQDQPLWGGDETHIAQAFPGSVGWLLDWSVNHYKTTDGQQADIPDYFTRKFAEMGIA